MGGSGGRAPQLTGASRLEGDGRLRLFGAVPGKYIRHRHSYR